tara:strand:+ start:311 stop:670 length:360 start_codon:yes stop_codon:yes gene_type:complete
LVVGGHHDNEVPDISDEEINLATEADGVEDHVAAYNDKHKEEIAAAAAKAAEEAAKHPVVETNNEIGSNASPAKTAPEAETKTEEIKTEEPDKADDKATINVNDKEKKNGNASCKCSIF